MARLGTLRQDTGAARIILARREGAILAQVGDQPALNAARLTELVAAELEMSFQLAEQLQSSEPLTIQYQAGSKVDLYTANIGRDHFLMLLFDVQARRGRIGTVWIFAQRAIKDLKGMLPVPAIPRVGSPDAEPAGQERQQQPEAGVRSEVEAANLANVEPIPAREEESSDTMEELEEPELTAVDIAALAEALGGVEPAGEELDLDAFWDEAASDVGGTGGKGLTFEEAMKRGLLPPEFGEEGR